MKSKLQFLPVVATLFIANGADNPVSPASIASINRSTASARRAAYSPSAIVSIKNRARLLADQPSPSNTRYFAVDDNSLRGLQPELLIDRLAPAPVKVTDNVRNLEIVVDIKKPITIWAPASKSPVNIGTASIESAPIRRSISTNADINFNTITIKGKTNE